MSKENDQHIWWFVHVDLNLSEGQPGYLALDIAARQQLEVPGGPFSFFEDVVSTRGNTIGGNVR